jgi:hypothetical protein
MELENVKSWYWTSDTYIVSVAVADVDADKQAEIVTGGHYWDGARDVAQLCVWSGATLALENVRTWYWTNNTVINSIAVQDLDGDNEAEIVTGGTYFDGTHQLAQLVVWDGPTLAVENVRTWYWTGYTLISSVAVGDVDGDAQMEIVTGGYHSDGTRLVAQLCVWEGATLALDNVRTWFWTGDTDISSVAIGDVNSDGAVDVLTGGKYFDGSRYVAQLCVWSGATLALENVRTWYWIDRTSIDSVDVGDVGSDGKVDIVTGGSYFDGTRDIAQLVVWNGATLELENVKAWYWTGDTFIHSVAVGNVDKDMRIEMVTGGCYNDGSRDVSQLCVWG